MWHLLILEGESSFPRADNVFNIAIVAGFETLVEIRVSTLLSEVVLYILL
jgi:hypothetical protein